MAAPKGNKFHELRDKSGRDKEVSSDQLMDLWEEYVSWTDDNPLSENVVVQKSGEIISVPKKRPLSLNRFFTYVRKTYSFSIKHYFYDKNGSYEDFSTTLTCVKDERDADVEEGALVGLYNGALAKSILGLVDKLESKQELKAEVKTEAKLDISKLSLEDKKALRELQRKMGVVEDGSSSSNS